MRKKMKAFLAICMVFVIIFALVACNASVNKETPSDTSNSNGVTSHIPNDETNESSSDDNTTENTENDNIQTLASTFTNESFTTTSGSLNYWLYTPSNATENMPLIVYLHGGSGKGENLDIVVSNEGFPKYLQDGRLGEVNSYVIIPQLSSNENGWISVSEIILQLISSVSDKFDIDESNISLTGHSMGGKGTWALALKYPKTFARIAPMSGSITNNANNLSKLTDVEIWAVVGSDDKIVTPESSIEFVTALKATNPNAKITVLEGADHFEVPEAYLDETMNIIGWLIGD